MVPLGALSVPTHAFRRGVIVYRQVPAGTELSAHESDPQLPLLSREQAEPGAIGVEDPSA